MNRELRDRLVEMKKLLKSGRSKHLQVIFKSNVRPDETSESNTRRQNYGGYCFKTISSYSLSDPGLCEAPFTSTL